MLTRHTINSGRAQKQAYYENDESLNQSEAQEEYYSKGEGQSADERMTQAVWYGQGARTLKLKGRVDSEDFKQLFEGVIPGTQKRIRPKPSNPDQRERLVNDFTFSAPKSISMLLHLGDDKRVFDAHTEAVTETLDLIESRYAGTRIQVNGVRQFVRTGNLAIALIPHHTSRELDAQLHTHCLIFNGTQGPDGAWRSLHADQMSHVRNLDGIYKQKLARKVQALGYTIRETAHGFEIEGVTDEQIKVFSKRTVNATKRVLAQGEELTAANIKRAAHATRKAKHITQTLEELQQSWQSEAKAVGIAVPRPGKTSQFCYQPEAARVELDSAIAHLSERSVAFTREDLEHSVFEQIQPFDVDDLNRELEHHPELIAANQRYTTQAAVERERAILERWLAGQGQATPLNPSPDLEESILNPSQAAAVRGTLTATDAHQIWQGLSGVGKTTALGELKRQLADQKIEIRGYCPTISAAGTLQQELGIPTQTVEALVRHSVDSTPNQLWIIDEAGMVSARQMLEVMRKADQVQARVLLVGDKGQNSAIEAGSPFRALQQQGVTTHNLRQIIRQQNSIQRQAVEAIAAGKGIEALSLLEQDGYVQQINKRKDRAGAIATSYLDLPPLERERTLIVTGTNQERLAITQALRTGLKAEGSLGAEMQTVQLQSKHLTQEQKSQTRNYKQGDYLRLLRDYVSTPLVRGELYKVEQCFEQELLVSSAGGRLYRFQPALYAQKEVYAVGSISIAVGDKLRWTATHRAQGRINGQSMTVTELGATTMTVVNAQGKPSTVSLLQPLAVDYDWVSTSYRAQGKTKTRVLVSATSDPTSSQEPFYVKISRQTKALAVYTKDLEQLKDWVGRSNAQVNALDLLEASQQVQPGLSQVWERDIPRPIDPKHGQEFEGSAILPELIELNAESLRGNEVYDRLLSAKLETLGTGQYVTQPMARVMARYETVADGGWWGKAGIEALSLINLAPGQRPELSQWGCFKPDQPRVEAQGGKRIKYEHPLGVSRGLYLPEVPTALAEQIYGHHGIAPTNAERVSGFWPIVLRYNLPIVLTEGFKKTLASLSRGVITIGVSGVNGLYQVKDEEGIRLPQRRLNPQVAVFATPGRELTLAFDQDTKLSAILNVRRDLVRGVELLEAQGCLCQVARWQPEQGKGLDDLIVGAGPRAYALALEQATGAALEKQSHYRYEYNRLAQAAIQELGEMPQERLDVEVYLRAVNKGEVADGARFVGESDRARILKGASEGEAEQYVAEIASVADLYERIKDQPQEKVDEAIQRIIQQRMVAERIQQTEGRQYRRGVGRSL